MDYRFQMYFLRGEKRKAFTEVKSHLVAENTLGTGTGAVGFHYSVGTDMLE
jgi:hypothetical protein